MDYLKLRKTNRFVPLLYATFLTGYNTQETGVLRGVKIKRGAIIGGRGLGLVLRPLYAVFRGVFGGAMLNPHKCFRKSHTDFAKLAEKPPLDRAGFVYYILSAGWGRFGRSV
jgi:hypothetical protein